MSDRVLQNRVRLLLPKLAFVAAIAMAGLIAVLSLLPGPDLPATSLNDKVSHLIAYGALMGAATVGRGRFGVLQAMALVIVFGLALEAAQGLMPFGRSASFLDAVANTAGVLIGTTAGLGFERIFSLRS